MPEFIVFVFNKILEMQMQLSSFYLAALFFCSYFVDLVLTLHDMKIMLQISHKINRLAYGDYFPGVVNPLDRYFPPSYSIILSYNISASYMWKFMSIVFLEIAVCNGHKTLPMGCINTFSRYFVLCHTYILLPFLLLC